MTTKNGSELQVKNTEARVAAAALVISIVAILVTQVRPLNEFFETPELSLKEFAESLNRCAAFLETLGIPTPYRWVAGIEGFKDRYLYIPNRERVEVPCLTDLIEVEGKYQKGDDAAELLRPFVDRVFDQCGVQRVPFEAVKGRGLVKKYPE